MDGKGQTERNEEVCMEVHYVIKRINMKKILNVGLHGWKITPKSR